MWWLSVFFILLLLCLYVDCCENRPSSKVEKIVKRTSDCEPHDIGLCMDTVTSAIASLLGGR